MGIMVKIYILVSLILSHHIIHSSRILFGFGNNLRVSFKAFITMDVIKYNLSKCNLHSYAIGFPLPLGPK